METAISVINLTPTTKEQAETFATKLIDEVMRGDVNPLELHVKMNAMQKSLDIVKKAIADQVLSEASKYGAKKFETMGAEIAICELGTKYNFENCGDSEWEKINNEINELQEKKKERENFLKTITPSVKVADANTGEMINPPIKSSTTGIKVTLK